MGSLLEFLSTNILYEILIVVWSLHFWEFYLSLRQRKLLQKLVDPPESLNGLMTKTEYEKARLYSLDKNTFCNIKEFCSVTRDTIFLLLLGLRYLWDWGFNLASLFGATEENEILVSLGCMFIMSCLSTIFDLPFTVYYHFVLEEKHGFNKQTASFFIKDQIKGFIVAQVVSLPILSGVIWIIKNGGDMFNLYLWIFSVLVTLFMMIIYPEVIAPLFDKYYPMPEGELKVKIEALASSLEFPLYKLYIVEGSKRSSHSNAYMYGFHKHKRIVLFDTLIKEYYKPEKEDEDKEKGCETNEVLAVLAHELGHWKYNHVLKGFILAQIGIVINFYCFAKLMNYTPIYAAFGFENIQPTFIGLIIVISYILIPINTLLNFLSTTNSRRFEFQADQFALKLGHGEALKSALVKLSKDNLGYPIYDKLYSDWHHSHPPFLVRLEALDKAK